MFVRKWAAGLLGVAGLLAATLTARAGDTIRLALPAQAAGATLKLGQVDPEADVLDVRFHGGFRGFAGHRGFYGGYRGFYGGYRGFYGGYYGYRPVYRYGYSYPVYPRAYIYSYGYYPQYYSYSYCPISSPVVTTSTFSLSIVPPTPPSALRVMPSADSVAPGVLPSPYPAGKDGTFDYDGGPAAPVPAPRADPAPLPSSPPVPLEGRPVSLPVRAAPKYSYPAYGELPR